MRHENLDFRREVWTRDRNLGVISTENLGTWVEERREKKRGLRIETWDTPTFRVQRMKKVREVWPK